MRPREGAGYGERLRLARTRHNLTQEQLAERIGASVASINRWEHERSFPRADQRQRLCALYGLPTDELFPNVGETNPALRPPRASASLPETGKGALADTMARATSAATTGAYPQPFATNERTEQPAPLHDSPAWLWEAQRVRDLDLGDPTFKQGRRPPSRYFVRADFAAVRAALRNAAATGRGGVVLFGPSMVGKTRMALEALRYECSDFLLAAWPRYDDALPALDEFAGARVVLLLDDLHELANQYEAGRIAAVVRHLLRRTASLLVVATSRSGSDEAATHQRFDGLIESLEMHVTHLAPMSRGDEESERFLHFARELAAADPARRLSLDTFDGTPGSVLLGLERRTTQLRLPGFPSGAKAVLKALALLRAAMVHQHTEARVRRVAERVFEVPAGRWSSALDHLIGGGWVTLDEGNAHGESLLLVPADAYLDVCLAESGVYPQSRRKVTSDFPRLYEALREVPTDVEALFALCRAIHNGRGDISTRWNELGLRCASRGLEAVDRQSEPVLWARGQYLLGMSYWQYWQGDERENARRTVAALVAAETVLTREALPAQWAAIQRALGIALISALADPRAEAMVEGVARLESSLAEFTREVSPYDWARTHNALGVAWMQSRDGPDGEWKPDFGRAVAHFLLAREVFTRVAYPEFWMIVMRNLGEVHSLWAEASAQDADAPGPPPEEDGISYCQRVLDAGMRAAYPYDWARTHVVLGEIYARRSCGDRGQNLLTAIAHFEAALEVLTASDYQADREIVLADLAHVRAHFTERVPSPPAVVRKGANEMKGRE